MLFFLLRTSWRSLARQRLPPPLESVGLSIFSFANITAQCFSPGRLVFTATIKTGASSNCCCVLLQWQNRCDLYFKLLIICLILLVRGRVRVVNPSVPSAPSDMSSLLGDQRDSRPAWALFDCENSTSCPRPEGIHCEIETQRGISGQPGWGQGAREGLKANSLLPVWYMSKPTGCRAETPSLRSLTRLSNRDGRSLPTLWPKLVLY